MGRNPLTKKETVSLFHDFKSFIDTDGTGRDKIAVDELKNLYNSQYKQVRRQNQLKVPTFYSLAKVIRVAGLGYFQGNSFYFGDKPRRRRRERKSQDYDAGGEVTNLSRNHARVRMAVDQHLNLKSKATDQSTEATSARLSIDKLSRNELYCKICSVSCTSERSAEEHLRGKRHKQMAAILTLKGQRENLSVGIKGVEISSDLPEDKDTFSVELQGTFEKAAQLIVTNNGSADVKLIRCQLLKETPVLVLHDAYNITTNGNKCILLRKGASYTVQLKCKSTDGEVGCYHTPVMFQFLVADNEQWVSAHMVRYLEASLVDDVVKGAQPTTKYHPPPRSTRSDVHVEEYIPGIKPPSKAKDHLEKKLELKTYAVPDKLRKMINHGLHSTEKLSDDEVKQMVQLRSMLEKDVEMSTYHQRFDTLLYMEEVQMEVDIKQYDMHEVTMTVYKNNKQLLLLKVPGLAEGRPSILRGDSLFVRVCEAEKQLGKQEYEGCVHEVHLDDVALGFGRRFRDQFIENMKFHVRFKFNRLPLKLQHRACHMAADRHLDHLLFPTTNDMLDWVALSDEYKFYDRSLENNAEQRSAVEHIVAGSSMPAPYLVFGPPGTGKTVTIVEAMKQVWKKSDKNIILACAPSNSAADLITARLLAHLPAKEIFRLNASSRTWSSIQDDVKKVSNYNLESQDFYFPSVRDLCDYRIIITTLVTAGRLVTASFPPGYFTHIFIDEAGHAIEPECIIALAGLMTSEAKGQLVIAGDPKQLGPILRSPLAKKYKLDVSLLERLMETRDIYKPTTTESNHKAYNNHVITKLLKNYRSHPKILKLPNEMFYDSELIPSGDLRVEKLCKWSELPKKNFPLLFHGVIGKDKREEKSPSFFNAEEVSQVVYYVKQLLSPQFKNPGGKLTQKEIGVITPYRKQVEKVRKALGKEYKNVMVGSVEEFQGQERTVIIVSTVRSNPEHLSLDLNFKLGFLRNQKRFNVTVTRAKALLVIIGNPDTLSLDYHWRSLIDYCHENGGYKGRARTSENSLDQITATLAQLQIIDNNYQVIMSLYNNQSFAKNDDDED